MTDINELKNQLSQFMGGDTPYRHNLIRTFNYTSGTRYFARQAGAYWFLDICATEIFRLSRVEPFIKIVLNVTDKKEATITADDGNGNVIYTRSIDYTDCPEGEWKFYIENGLMMLPNER